MEKSPREQLMEIVSLVQSFQNVYLPKGCHLHIDLNGHNAGHIYVHTHQDHSVGLRVKRILGIEDATKCNYDPQDPWHTLSAKLDENHQLSIMCKGLPPMCRIETYEEEVPKEQVVQTGEKTIVRRTRICCGEEK